ncbi:MAG: hypothetical protein OHK0032_01740 [Thermodesulfovibrionales bacterium]
MVLGQYCSPQRGEDTALLVFSCLKRALSKESNQNIFELLQEPVKSLWENASLNGTSDDADCITLAKRMGNYPYRAAAEKAFEVIFASIREIMDDNANDKIISFLPPPLKVIFERSRSCALDGSAGDFL